MIEGQVGEEAYPFGGSEPFNGLEITDPKTGDVRLHYKPNAKQWIAHNCCADEIFYGGAVFSGKSVWLTYHNAAHCLAYGKRANTVLFRRTFPQLEHNLIPLQISLFDKLLGEYLAGQHLFRWFNGARTTFSHLEDWHAVRNHQGASYTLQGFDELTDFEERMYTRLGLWSRAGMGEHVHCQRLSTSNPRGPGHHWVMNRFIADKEPNRTYAFIEPAHMLGELQLPERRLTRIFVPARAEDNKEGLAANPDYLASLKEGRSPDEYKAFVEGDWTIFEGRAFPEWDPRVHIVEPFNVPKNWKVIRALDWGYASPFSVGWWTQDPQTRRVFRIDEWYGARTGPHGGVDGMEMAVGDVRGEILRREEAAVVLGRYPRPWYGEADPTIWERRAGPQNIGTEMNAVTPLFEMADNRPGSREYGKQVFHSLLRVDMQTGQPGFGSFRTCEHFNALIPMLARAENGKEDIQPNRNDHLWDEGRYAWTNLFVGTRKRPVWQQPEHQYQPIPQLV